MVERVGLYGDIQRDVMSLITVAAVPKSAGRSRWSASRPVEMQARLRLAASDHTRRHNDRIDRTSAGTADGIDDDVVLLQQPVEHAPGEGTERASTLQGQRDVTLLPVRGSRGSAMGFIRCP